MRGLPKRGISRKRESDFGRITLCFDITLLGEESPSLANEMSLQPPEWILTQSHVTLLLPDKLK